MFKLKIAARRRAIFAACSDLGMDEEDRHALQRSLIGKESLSAMSLPELDTLLDHLNRRSRGAAHFEGAPAGLDSDPQLQKIEALLADQRLPWRYLTASTRGPSMCQRLAGVARLEWASAEGKRAIIAALAKRQAKQGKAG